MLIPTTKVKCKPLGGMEEKHVIKEKTGSVLSDKKVEKTVTKKKT